MDQRSITLVGPQPRRHRVVRTLCVRCLGEGLDVRPRAAHGVTGRLLQGTEVRPCSACGGGGWLPGIAVPV